MSLLLFSRVTHLPTLHQFRSAPKMLPWHKSIKYLGVQFESGIVLQTDNDIIVRKFYAAANAICSHVKFASEISVLFLINVKKL